MTALDGASGIGPADVEIPSVPACTPRTPAGESAGVAVLTPSRERQYFNLLETNGSATDDHVDAASHEHDHIRGQQHQHEHDHKDEEPSLHPRAVPSARLPEGWRAAAHLLPSSWPERERASGAEFDAARSAALRYASRRYRDPEAAEALACEPIPQPHEPVHTVWPGERAGVAWPVGAPSRPVSQHQLWNDCVWTNGKAVSADQSEIDAWLVKAAAAVAAYEAIDDAEQAHEAALASAAEPGIPALTAARRRCEATRLLRVLKDLPRPDPPRTTLTLKQDRLAPYARGIIWNSENPEDVYPEQPSTADDPPPSEVNHSFFSSWADKLGWGDDDMLHQAVSGVDSRSACDLATVLRFHHKGFQKCFRPARVSIEKDTDSSRRWITPGRPHLPYVPSRLIARNVAVRHMWRMRNGKAVKVLKHRVTTDDSMEDEDTGVAARNSCLPRDDWPPLNLPGVRTIGRAVAILKARMPEAAAERLIALALEAGITEEKIVLWAIDLSDAYRHLGIQRLERWLQVFIWSDGCRTDQRCVFGTAHMVQFFERVSTFLLAVIAFRQREFDSSRPYSEARQAWVARRGGGEPTFRMVYIDDAMGAVVHGADEPIHRRTDENFAVIDPSAEETRVEAYLRIASETSAEAGWPVQLEKVQADLSIEGLGFSIETMGEGRLACTPAKRAGIESELAAQQEPGVTEVPTDDVESIGGKLIHLAEVMVEGRAHLEPFYTMLRATRRQIIRGRAVRVGPNKLAVGGAGATAARYQRSVSWWRAALSNDISIPLAPRLLFPTGGDEGCLITYQDAARGWETGFGGFAPLAGAAGQLHMPFVSGVWPEDLQQSLMSNALSMAAGEMFTFVITTASMAHHVRGTSHVIGLTDSSATAAAINSGASGSPQMQALLLWLYELCPGLQMLAIWLPGVENTRADHLSRGRQRAAAVVAEAEAVGWQTANLPLPPHAFDRLRAIALLAHAD